MRSEDAAAVRLLGRPALRNPAGDWVEVLPGLAGAALCYLGFHDRTVSRDELIALFWPDHAEPQARLNLRSLLWRLNRDPLVPGLECERPHVRWWVHSDLAEATLAAADQRWQQAWALLRDDLLTGFVVPRAPEFESWLELERAALRDLRRGVGMRLADDASADERFEDAVEILSLLYRSDPFDEGVVRSLMRVLARRGSRSEALKVFAGFARRAEEELGVAPETASLSLADAIREGRVPGRGPPAREAASDARARPPVAVPVPATPLVGRRAELREIEQRLDDPGCRFLVLVGPGGVGKTRLAVELARAATGRVRRRVAFADLTSVSNEPGVLAAIGAAVGWTGVTASHDEAAVVRAIEATPTLLLLDDLDQLACAPALVARLLDASQTVQVLATSRSTTGVASEVTFDVDGLAVREEAEAGAPFGRPRRATTASEAATLFAQVATRVRHDFAPGPGDDAAIERICTRLGGSPLAIELAAAWVRVLGVGAIEAALEQGVDLLQRDGGEGAHRHASVRDVFERSWAMLQPREQRALRRLSVCRGGFTVEAAHEVAELELPVLLALVNKSFLRRLPSGRFDGHPLVWQCTLEQAAAHPDEAEAACALHARHYLRLVAAGVDAYHRRDGATHMHDIAVDLENVAAAWRWAARTGDEALLSGAVRSLGQFCWSRGRFDLKDELFSLALASATPEGLLQGRLLVGLGVSATWSGLGIDRREDIVAGIRILERVGADDDLAFAYRSLGIAHNKVRAWESAEPAFEAGASEYERLGDAEGALMMTISRCGNAERVRDAVARYETAMERARRANEMHPVAMALSGHAFMLRLLGSYPEALASNREAIRLHDSTRVPFWAVEQRLNRADVELARGRLPYAQAASCWVIDRCDRERANQFADRAGAAMVLMARLHLVRDDAASARTWCERALETHRHAHGTRRSFDRALTALARAHLRHGRTGDALRALDGADDRGDLRWWRGRHADEEGSVDLATCRAEVAVARGDGRDAATTLLSALERARRHELVAAALHALAVAADVFALDGDAERAAELWGYVRSHPRSPYEASVRATRSANAAAGREHGCSPAARPGQSEVADDGVDGVLGVVDAAIARLAGGARASVRGVDREDRP